MKKFIIPMMLGLITVGALTSCNSEPTTNHANENYNIVNVKRANETETIKARVVTKVNDLDLRGIKNTSAKELGLPTTKVTAPHWDDFDSAETFDFMGYKYTATTTDGSTTIKKTGYSDDYKEVETVYCGTINGASSFTQNFTSFAGFEKAKTAVDVIMISSSINSAPLLENIYIGSNCNINNQLKNTIKHIVFTTDPVSVNGLKYVSTETKLIAPASIAVNIRKKIDTCFKDEKDYMSVNPTLYVVPDEDVLYKAEEFRTVYEIGGAYISASGSGELSYGISYLGDNAKKVVCDMSLLDDFKTYSYAFAARNYDYENTKIEEMYFKYPKLTSNALFSPFEIEKLYLGNITSEFWASYHDGAKEVYFPDGLSYGYDSVHINNGEDIKNTTYFFPNSEKESSNIYANLIETLESTSGAKIGYYDASSYTPTMEVEVNGVRKSTKDMTVSYSELVAEAAEEAEKASNGELSEDEMTEEEKQKLAEDKAAADEVIALIDTIGEVTLDSRDVIVNTKAAYDKLTYDQQQLVENKETLKEAVIAFNELVNEYNENLEEDEEKLELIEEINDKTKFDDFLDSIQDNKVLTAVTVILGTVLGGFLIYGLYKLISMLIKWVRR